MLAELTSPSRKLASALPVPETPGRSVISGLMAKLPAEPRSRISSLAPARNSDAEFEGVLAAIPGERIQNLAVEDRGLEAVDGGRRCPARRSRES